MVSASNIRAAVDSVTFDLAGQDVSATLSADSMIRHAEPHITQAIAILLNMRYVVPPNLYFLSSYLLT